MESLRKITKIKLGVMLSSMTLPIIIVVVMAVGRFEFTNQSIFYYWSPLPYIICALIEAYLAYKNYRYVKILKDDEYADYYLIKKNDERNRFIKTTSNNLVTKIFIYVLVVIAIFAAFTNRVLFYTLLALLAIYLIIYIAVNIHYFRKY